MAEKKAADKAGIKKYFLYGLIGFLVVFAIACGFIIYFTYSKSYVAKVGGERIKTADYKLFLKQEKDYMLSFLYNSQDMDEAAFWETKIEGEKIRDIAKKRALDSALEFKLQYIKAKEAGLRLTCEDNENVINTLKSLTPVQIQSRTQRDEYFKRSTGVNYKELESIYKEYEMIRKFQDRETAFIEPEEQQLRDHYDANRESFDNAALQHILIRTGEDASEQDLIKAEEKAKAVLGKAESGEDFEKLAKDNSEDQKFEFSFTKEESLAEGLEEFNKWVFDHEAGDMGIVKTQLGYHVVKHMGKAVTYEDLNEVFMQKLRASYVDQRYQNMINEWKQDIKYNLVINNSVYDKIN